MTAHKVVVICAVTEIIIGVIGLLYHTLNREGIAFWMMHICMGSGLLLTNRSQQTPNS